MRFVDEYRDADQAHALADRMAALCRPGRRYQFMEVCGGHTHAIYKHGLEDYLPDAVEMIHGRLPRLRHPNGPARRRVPHRRAARRHHDHLR